MRRLTRAIADVESFRNEMFPGTGWPSGSEYVVLSLLNTAIAALSQAEILAPMMRDFTGSRRMADRPSGDRGDALIEQINNEIRHRNGDAA